MLNYKLNKKQKLEQSYIYVANTIYNVMNDKGSKIVCFTSSLSNKLDKYLILKNVHGKMLNNGKNVLFINTDECVKDNSDVNFMNINDCSKKILQDVLNDNKDKYDMIMVNAAPVRLFANAVEYAKLCDSTIIMERYLYSRYSDYESTILKLNQNNVKISGVVTYK